MVEISLVDHKQFKDDLDTKIAFRYLYWACCRGQLYLIDYILKKFGLSPYMKGADEKSPFMIALENGKDSVVRLLISRKLYSKTKLNVLEHQKQAVDFFGNNPMHKACRFRNRNLIELLMQNNIGYLSKRNKLGMLHLEIPHNDILNDD